MVVVSFGSFFLLEEMQCWDIVFHYMQEWKLPKQFASASIKNIFDKKRVVKHRNSGKLNCSASELLSLLPVLAHFVRKVCRPPSAGAQAFLAMYGLLEILHVGFLATVTSSLVMQMVEKALLEWTNAGWPFRKKHHWLLHFHQSFEQHGYCISCFSMERKHKMITRKTTLIQNTTTFEASAMQEVVTDELQVLKEPESLDAGIKLLGSRKIGKKEINTAGQLWPLANVGTMSTASSARCQDGTIHVGDVVLYSGAGGLCACGQVSSLYQCGSECKVVLDNFALLEDNGTFAIWSNLQAGSVAVHLCEARTSVPYAMHMDKMTTLIPWRWR